MLAEHHELATQLGDDFALVLRLAMLEYMLYHVVTILVVNQVLSLLMKFIQYTGHLVHVTVLQNTLDDPTAVWVHCQL